MRSVLPEILLRMAENLPSPLYLVGGSVRDFLLGRSKEHIDWDLSSPAEESVFVEAAKKSGATVQAVFPRTGTVKLKGEGEEFEFTRFRTDKYVRGLHAPSEITFTDDIASDARRRDFCANAVYYDIKAGRYCDPLGGIGDIEKRILRTVAPAEKVFGEDGLRLLRLARIAAQTGFEPDNECLEGARKNSALILDIVPERIFTELRLLLLSDERGGRDAPYRGLCILRDTGVLAHIFPELALGDGMRQREDFHDHDVLEHSLRCVRYSSPEVRFAALLHDVGKPFAYLRDGNFHAHPEEGERIARDILTRLKAPKALIEETALLVGLHMKDSRLDMRENKVRRELVKCYPFLDKLFALKQADYSACKDDLSPAPAVVKWQKILAEMRDRHIPLTLKELAVNGDELQRAGVPREKTAAMLEALLDDCVIEVIPNRKYALLRRAEWRLQRGETK